MPTDRVIYTHLVACARAGQPTSYGEIGALVGLEMANPAQRNELADRLGTISSEEHAHARPLLLAVVVLKQDGGFGLPGVGFYKLARELAVARPGEPEDAFAIREMKAVFEFWGKTRDLDIRF